MYSNYALKSIRLWLLVAVCLIVLYSCKKEIAGIFNDQKPVPAEMQWAQDYYVQQLGPKADELFKPVTLMSADGKKGHANKTNKLTMRWDKATAANSALYNYVETPMTYEHKLTTTLKISADPLATPVADMDVISASFDRLVIYKDKKGVINQRIISYVPDKAYANRHNGNITGNRIGKLDKDFFGFLQYKTWEGKILFALRIENGRAVKRYGFEKSVTNTNISFRPVENATVLTPKKTMVFDGGGGGSVPPECTYVVSWDWYQDCYYYAGEEDPYKCDPIVVYNVQYAPAECPSEGGGGGSGGQPPMIDCTDPANFDSGYCEIDEDTDIRLDSLYKYYPCMVKLILNKLAQNNSYYQLTTPFLNPNYENKNLPRLDYSFDNFNWGGPNGTGVYFLGQTHPMPGSLWNSTIYFNKAALDNASQLFLAVSAIHEGAHAYAYYYIRARGGNVQVFGDTSSPWAMSLVDYAQAYADEAFMPNTVEHSIFLMDYYDKMVDILVSTFGNTYTLKEYRMAALYGMDYLGIAPDPQNSTPSQIAKYNQMSQAVLKSFNDIKIKYSINDYNMETFYQNNTMYTANGKKLPQNCP